MSFGTNATILLLLLVCCVFNVKGQRPLSNQQHPLPPESENLIQYWTNLTDFYQHYVTVRNFEILSSWNKLRQSTRVKTVVSERCLSVLEYIVRHPIDQEWTAKLIDSNQLLSSGMMSGTSTELGDFDQCLSIRSQFDNQNFVGKYCLATINLPRTKLFEPLSSQSFNHTLLRYPWLGPYIEQWHNNDNYYSAANAICFPSICDQNEIRAILLEYYKPLNYFEFNVTYCQSLEETPKYDSRIWIALSILALPWIFIIPGTLLDLLVVVDHHQSQPQSTIDKVNRYRQPWFDRQSWFCQILLSFSLITNLRQLYQIKDSNPAGNGATIGSNNKNGGNPGSGTVVVRFDFVHGIRAIAAIFIVLAHSGGLILIFLHMPVSIIARNPTDSIAISRSLIAQPFYNGALIVMTFFVMSGMFVVYCTAQPNRLKINFFKFVTLRWLRYTPPVIGMLCLTVCLEFLGNGPLFHHDIVWPTLEKCYDNWIPEILYYSNFRDYSKMCGVHTWYLSAEMQLNLVSFVLLLIYTRSRRWTLFTSVALIGLAVTLIVAIITSGLAPVVRVQRIIHTQNPSPHDTTALLFFSPHMQFIPYFIGTIIGQLLLEKRILKLSKSTKQICWSLSIFLILTIPFASYVDVQTDEDVNYKGYRLTDAILFSSVLLLWSVANGWLIYQCAINPGNLIARFLSAKIFRPLSRLSFSLYLAHLMTIWFIHHQTRTLVSLTTFNDVFKNISYTIALSLVTSTILYATFEAPSVRLIKLLMKSNNTTAGPNSRKLVSGQLANVNSTGSGTPTTTDRNNNNSVQLHRRQGSLDGDTIDIRLTRSNNNNYNNSPNSSQIDLQLAEHVEFNHSAQH